MSGLGEYLVTDELSIGDYVLTGGELPAMVDYRQRRAAAAWCARQ